MQSYFELLSQTDPRVYEILRGEEERQRHGVELIPSENYTYPEVLATLGSVFTNKYSEGYPGRRYYGGQRYTDAVEELARERARKLFRAEHANVQPLSGSPMNQAVYLGLLDPGDTILAMDLSHGGHLTHGAPVSHMGRLYNFERYKTDPRDGSFDFDEIRKTALKTRPKLVLAGYTSYPRDLDYAAFKEIADEVGALTMCDASHYAGMVAGEALANPLDFGFDVMTTTSHKSLRGPRGGMILCKKELAAKIDKSVFPGLQGGPHMNVIAGIAVAMEKALKPEFKDYASRVLANARAMAAVFLDQGGSLITGGTGNHMLVVDTEKSFGVNGKAAEELLDKVGVTTNKQIIPDDPNPPLRPSGIRIGTPAATTRGMKESDMTLLADWMVEVLSNPGDEALHQAIHHKVESLCDRFPVPGLD